VVLRFPFIVSLMILNLGVAAGAAAEEEGSCTKVSIAVRTLLGSNPLPHGAAEVRKIGLAREIEDLAPQLSRLLYQNFQLLDSRQVVVKLTRRRQIDLSQGQKLAFRPMYVEDKRVGMWMRWDDDRGMRLLDTMMHFEGGESIVTGVETSRDKGYILVIEVHPIYE